MLRKLLERAIAAVPEATIAAYSGDSIFVSLGHEHFCLKEGEKATPCEWPQNALLFENDTLEEVKFWIDTVQNVQYLI